MFSIRPGNKPTEQAVENTEFTSVEKKTRMFWSQVKIMLVCFFDHKGIVHCEFIAQGQKVNQQCYLDVLTGYGNVFGGKDPGSGLISGFSTMTTPLRMMR